MIFSALIMGVVPMVFFTYAGSEMRQAIGVAVFAGMTIFGLVLTPLFYYALSKRGKGKIIPHKQPPAQANFMKIEHVE